MDFDNILQGLDEIKKEPVDDASSFNPVIVKCEPLDEGEFEEQQNIPEITTTLYKSAPVTKRGDPRGKFAPQISNEAPVNDLYFKKNPQREDLSANLSEALLRQEENDSLDQHSNSKRRRLTNNEEDVPMAMRGPPERAQLNSKPTKTVGVQTTKNDGYFSIILDLKDMSKGKRQALKDFKKAMGIEDDSSTAGILERLEHRRANMASDHNPRVNSSRMSIPPSAPKYDLSKNNHPNKSQDFVFK